MHVQRAVRTAACSALAIQPCRAHHLPASSTDTAQGRLCLSSAQEQAQAEEHKRGRESGRSAAGLPQSYRSEPHCILMLWYKTKTVKMCLSSLAAAATPPSLSDASKARQPHVQTAQGGACARTLSVWPWMVASGTVARRSHSLTVASKEPDTKWCGDAAPRASAVIHPLCEANPRRF